MKMILLLIVLVSALLLTGCCCCCPSGGSSYDTGDTAGSSVLPLAEAGECIAGSACDMNAQ